VQKTQEVYCTKLAGGGKIKQEYQEVNDTKEIEDKRVERRFRRNKETK